MEFREFGAVELAYAALEHVDYASGGQWYGTMEGSLTGPRLAGNLRLTNLALNRPDNVNTPTLRGLLRTHDDAELWVELDGIARLVDETRVFGLVRKVLGSSPTSGAQPSGIRPRGRDERLEEEVVGHVFRVPLDREAEAR